MNKWYRSGLVKGILIVLQHVFVVITVISIIWIMAYPGLMQDMVFGKKAQEYKDSEGFSSQVTNDSFEILQGIYYGKQLETDGVYNGKKIVDIKEYYEKDTIPDENVNGLAYSLEDLAQWGSNTEMVYDYSNSAEPIIVCKKSDGTYDYYYYSQFYSLFTDGKLFFVSDNSDYNTADILDRLRNGTLYEGSSSYSTIKDAENTIKYVDYWNYNGERLLEQYPPIGAKDLLEIVNTSPQWNGKLSDAYNYIQSVAQRLYQAVDFYESSLETWKEGDTNLFYLYADHENKKVYTNRADFQNYADLNKNITSLKALGKYTSVTPKLADFETNMNGIEGATFKQSASHLRIAKENFQYVIAVDTEYPIQDAYYSQNKLYDEYAPTIRGIAVLGLLSVILFIIASVWLTVIAGRKCQDEEIHLHPFDRWKTELAAVLVVGVWLFLTMMLTSIVSVSSSGRSGFPYTLDITQNISVLILCAMIAIFSCTMFFVGYLSLVRRIKARTLWKNSILYWLIGFFMQVCSHIHSVWKTALLLAGYMIIHWVAAATYGNGFFILLMLAADALAVIYLLRQTLFLQRIVAGIKRIASGEVQHKIALHGLTGDYLLLAEKVNTIGEGLDAAVEANMKSERLKTDLITNVSHDIKTPLTSIINYVDLLKRENFTDPKILGYLDILETKAQRLKTLTEDVVEASKVSSGNISLEWMNINLVEMIQQTSGEFEEKFKKRGLQEVLLLPDTEAIIRADGRRMWRILENIYNNAAKYAMEGTRVYAELKTTDSQILFSLKNISDQPLNITAEELTERFIRGDVSRSTEGSGLGLSIAKSLTEMLGGSFDLYLDGDLFRVTIAFSKAAEIIH